MLSVATIFAREKYTVKLQGGLEQSECKGYNDWTAVTVSLTQGR